MTVTTVMTVMTVTTMSPVTMGKTAVEIEKDHNLVLST